LLALVDREQHVTGPSIGVAKVVKQGGEPIVVTLEHLEAAVPRRRRPGVTEGAGDAPREPFERVVLRRERWHDDPLLR
jgi:hypothetical protein